MKNIQYQQKAVSELVEKTIGLLSLSGNRHTLVFKAPTGSGKTVMASDMLMRLNDELTERPDAPFTEVAYIWIAPNKLHEQSYFKMKNYFTETKILRPMIYDELDHSIEGYIHPGEILFVNWESINKDNAVIVRETELSASLYDITRRNHRRGAHVRKSQCEKIGKSAEQHLSESGNPYFSHTSTGINRKGGRTGYGSTRTCYCRTDDQGKCHSESGTGVQSDAWYIEPATYQSCFEKARRTGGCLSERRCGHQSFAPDTIAK